MPLAKRIINAGVCKLSVFPLHCRDSEHKSGHRDARKGAAQKKHGKKKKLAPSATIDLNPVSPQDASYARGVTVYHVLAETLSEK